MMQDQSTRVTETEHLPAERPRCRQHGYMTLRPLAQQSREQAFCGTWYDCPEPHCLTSALLPSRELQHQLGGRS